METLEAVAKDINSRVDEINEALGTHLDRSLAPPPGWTTVPPERFSGHLAGVALYYEFLDDGCDPVAGEPAIDGAYLDHFKRVWDMYVKNSSQTQRH